MNNRIPELESENKRLDKLCDELDNALKESHEETAAAQKEIARLMRDNNALRAEIGRMRESDAAQHDHDAS